MRLLILGLLLPLCAVFPSLAQQAPGSPALTLDGTLSPAADQPTALAMSGPATPPVTAKTVMAEPAAGQAEAPLIVLGAGDLIALQVYGRPELAISAYVADNGTVAVPLAGPVQVAGLSPAEASSRVAEAYRSGGYLLQPQVNITLQQFHSQQISVLGEVRTPGRYVLESRTNIFDLLAQAGGVTTDAADTVYLLRQDDKDKSQVLRIAVTLQDLARHSATGLALRGGDSLYIPKAPQFYIYGAVHTPNRYRLDSGMTVIQAIALSGGVTDRGSERRVEIRRRNADGSFTTFDAHTNDRVEADDVIRIKERIF